MCRKRAFKRCRGARRVRAEGGISAAVFARVFDECDESESGAFLFVVFSAISGGRLAACVVSDLFFGGGFYVVCACLLYAACILCGEDFGGVCVDEVRQNYALSECGSIRSVVVVANCRTFFGLKGEKSLLFCRAIHYVTECRKGVCLRTWLPRVKTDSENL